MAKRFFTSDFHFNAKQFIDAKIRPFKSVDKMNNALIRSCNERAKMDDDIIIHLGDLCFSGSKLNKPNDFIREINATFVNIKGNHDINNKVKSLADSMRIKLGKVFPSVSCSHYPSYHPNAKGSFVSGDIHLHGHRHEGNIFTIDKKNLVLNVNMCCDLWNYHIISEDELISEINKFLTNQKFFTLFKK